MPVGLSGAGGGVDGAAGTGASGAGRGVMAMVRSTSGTGAAYW
jgi:hypothetical protein